MGICHFSLNFFFIIHMVTYVIKASCHNRSINYTAKKQVDVDY